MNLTVKVRWSESVGRTEIFRTELVIERAGKSNFRYSFFQQGTHSRKSVISMKFARARIARLRVLAASNHACLVNVQVDVFK